jgi:TonB family protein
MLTTLLESKSHRSHDRRGAAVSVVVHASLILGAVYATASGSPAPEPEEERIHSFPLVIRPHAQPKSAPATAAPKTSTHPLPRTITTPIEIPAFIPKIDVNAAPVTSEDFIILSRGASSAGDTGSTSRETGRRAYQDFEVESPASAIGVVSPEYPPALRSSGVEGRVTAQFIVNERGRFEEASLEILSSTNALFVESIRRALPRMKFRPAKIGDRAVPQLVRQEFSFVLEH